MKKLALYILSLAAALSLASCGGESSGPLVKPVDPSPVTDEGAPDTGEAPNPLYPGEAETAGDDADALPETPAEAPVYAEASGAGFVFEYDPELFEKSGEGDIWLSPDAQLSLSVTSLPDTSPEDAAKSVLADAGLEGEPDTVYFGAEGVQALSVTVSTPGGSRRFFALPFGGGTMLVEAVTADSAPERSRAGLDNILATFTLVQ